MALFCLLWVPLFYLFWRSLNEEVVPEGGIWALILGTIVAFVRFFLGALVDPGGFGLTRWISACIDVVALPAAIPYVVCLIFALFRLIPSQANFTNFAFLWLIPVAAVRALGWSSQSNPILLMATPVLWTAIVMGMGLLIRLVQTDWGWIAIPAILGAIAIPLAAATSYWALFVQRTILGLSLLALCLVPTVISIVISVISFVAGRKGQKASAPSE